MFTGLVRERGVVVEVDTSVAGASLVVEAPGTAAAAAVGDSIAVDGVCLTATRVDDGRVFFDAVPETLARTTLGRLDAGAEVNVEPALRVGEPLGGHYVQGHVDGVGVVRALAREGDGLRVTFAAAPELARYCADKGSIALQGVSLTIAATTADGFEVALIPHTLEVTTLGSLAVGDEVNLEVDVLAKYVERLLTR